MFLTDISNIFCYDKSLDKKNFLILSHIRATKKRMRIGNANKTEIKKKKCMQTERFATRFVGRSNALLPPYERDGLEDAMDRGTVDKRGDMGLIAAFTLTAHQSHSTTSCNPTSTSLFLFLFLSPSLSLPPSLFPSRLLLCMIRKRENR